MRFLLLLVAVLLMASFVAVAPVYSAEAPTAWSFLPADARVVAGLDVTWLKKSGFKQSIEKQMSAAGTSAKFGGAGEDVLNMVERVTLAAAMDAGAKEPRLLIVLEGALDKAKLRKTLAAGTAVERYKGVELFLPPRSRKTDMLLAVVSERLALLGDRAMIEEALAQREKAPGGLVQRAIPLSAKSQLWIAADQLKDLMPPAKGAGAGVMSDLDRFEFSADFSKGLLLELLLGMENPDGAKGMLATMESARYMAGKDATLGATFSELLKGLTVAQDGNDVKATLQFTRAQFDRLAADFGRDMGQRMLAMAPMMMAGMAGGASPGLGWEGVRPAVRASGESGTSVMPKPVFPNLQNALAAPVALPPPPPVKRTIKIVGLDEGEKEVTYVRK